MNDFLASHVFGRYRRDLLDESLKRLDQVAQQKQTDATAAVRRAITENETKTKRLLRSPELTDEIDQNLIRDINERRAELRAEHDELALKLGELENHARETTRPGLLNHTCPSGRSIWPACPTTYPEGSSTPSNWKSTTTTPPRSRPAASR